MILSSLFLGGLNHFHIHCGKSCLFSGLSFDVFLIQILFQKIWSFFLFHYNDLVDKSSQMFQVDLGIIFFLFFNLFNFRNGFEEFPCHFNVFGKESPINKSLIPYHRVVVLVVYFFK